MCFHVDHGSSQILGLFQESIHRPHRPGSLALILQPGVIGAPQGAHLSPVTACMPGFLRLRRYPLPCGGDSGSRTALWVPFRELQPHGNGRSALKFSPGPTDRRWLCHRCCRGPARWPCLGLHFRSSLRRPWQLSIWVMVVSFGPHGCLLFALQTPLYLSLP